MFVCSFCICVCYMCVLHVCIFMWCVCCASECLFLFSCFACDMFCTVCMGHVNVCCILCLHLCVPTLSVCELLDFYYFYVLYVCACHDICVQVKGQLWESFLFSSWGAWGSNSGCQAWRHVPLLSELAMCELWYVVCIAVVCVCYHVPAWDHCCQGVCFITTWMLYIISWCLHLWYIIYVCHVYPAWHPWMCPHTLASPGSSCCD